MMWHNVLSKSKGAKKRVGRGLGWGSHTAFIGERPEFVAHLIPCETTVRVTKRRKGVLWERLLASGSKGTLGIKVGRQGPS